MKNFDLAKKIKELRSRKGYSQDELAEYSQLSLRTIQRIENGETEPRGDTLKRLANALNVTPDEMIDWAEQEDKGYLAFLNLSALGFIAFPLLGIIIPLALWLLKKGKIKYVDDAGKSVINFQITWCIIAFIVYVWFVVTTLLHLNTFNLSDLPKFIIVGLYLINLILIVFNTIRSLKAKKVIYQPAIPFLR